VSTERGRDPRGFALLAFGGSGPVHAAGLARDLLIGRVLIPPLPGLFSAVGLLCSGVQHHDVRSCLLSGAALTAEALENVRGEMQAHMLDQFRAEGFAPDAVRLSWSVDVRYRGQASQTRIPLDGGRLTGEALRKLEADFGEEHERLYGHRSDPDNPVEVVAVRLVGTEISRGPASPVASAPGVAPAGGFEPAERSRRAYFGADYGSIDTPVVTRADIDDGARGPLLIDEYDSTTVVPPGWGVRRDGEGNLMLEVISHGTPTE